MTIVNRAEFARIVGRSPRQVANWIDQGMPAQGAGRKGGRLRIDTAEAIGWLVRRAEGRADAANSGLTQERERKLRLENDAAEGRLVTVDEVIQSDSELFVHVKRMVLDLGSRLPPVVAGERDPAQQRKAIDAECREILNVAAARLRADAAGPRRRAKGGRRRSARGNGASHA